MMSDTSQTEKRAVARDVAGKNRYRIDVRPTNTGARGQLYDVVFNGEVIVRSSINPTPEACRYLVATGHTGSLETWGGEPYPRIIVPDIAVMAGLSVREGESGLRIRRYQPFDRSVF